VLHQRPNTFAQTCLLALSFFLAVERRTIHSARWLLTSAVTAKRKVVTYVLKNQKELIRTGANKPAFESTSLISGLPFNPWPQLS
jgi:hypothetical protein